jgi:hypothetical protein
MMFNIILLTKLLIIIVSLICLPTMYIFLRVYWFSLTMSNILEWRVINFYLLFYVCKILLIFFVLNILLFLAFIDLFLLVKLINLGIVY